MGLSDFNPDALIFDVDGVLLDVRNSFPEVIRLSVLEGWQSFCGGIVGVARCANDAPGYTPEHARILKQHGAFNDDYDIVWVLLSMAAGTGESALSKAFPSPERLIGELQSLDGDLVAWTLSRYGERVPRDKIREVCMRRYFSELYTRELPMLRCHWGELPLPTAIYTGRNGAEWILAKKALGWEDFPDRLVVHSDSDIKKPSPEGLRLLCERLGASKPAFFGDTRSDMMAAQAFGKGYFVAIGDLLPDVQFIYETPERALEALLNFKIAGDNDV